MLYSIVALVGRSSVRVKTVPLYKPRYLIWLSSGKVSVECSVGLHPCVVSKYEYQQYRGGYAKQRFLAENCKCDIYKLYKLYINYILPYNIMLQHCEMVNNIKTRILVTDSNAIARE